jgi:hypothetical protein
MKIEKNLVIDFEDIIQDQTEDRPTYNNMHFYLCNEKRLRFKLNALDNKFYKNNKFYKCFDEVSLEVLKPNEWQELSKMSLEDMTKVVEDNEWDWLGDDFDDMQNYLYFIEDHNSNVAFTTKTVGYDECIDVSLHDISMYNDREKQIYKKGLSDGS